MALSKMFKKSDAPDELPDLAIDELKKELKTNSEEKPKEEKIEKKVVETEEESKKPEEVEEKEPELREEAPSEPAEEVQEEKIPEENEESESEDVVVYKAEASSEKSVEEKTNLERSFFNPLIDELKKENFDPAKVNAWYQKRFSDKSVIEEMKEYWEKQKNEFITETVENEFKARIKERMSHLQKLESEWQEIYIKLVEKEEEMKKEEKNVKKIIKDFSAVVKKNGNLKKAHKPKIINEKKKKS